MKKTFILTSFFVILVTSTIWTSKVNAYPTYSEARDATNCRMCHLDFRGSPYVSLNDGTSWGVNLENGHFNNMLSSTTCFSCHSSGGFFPVSLGSSSDLTLSMSCVGCHGRSEDAGNDTQSPGLGAGLRQQHYNVGIAMCAECHSDADPSNYTPVGEGVLPPNYGKSNVALMDSCDVDGSESIFGSAGLDNDGDGLYDGNDPDCVLNQPPIADPNGPYTGTVGQSVQFDGTGSFDPEGTIISYDWNFGDGNIGTGDTPTHTYTAAETYTVILTVTDNEGATDTASTISTILSGQTQEFCKGNFDYDTDVDGGDAFVFKQHFGRSVFKNPCPPDGPAPVPKTWQTPSYGTGDDGDLEKGVEWPAPRWTDNVDGTVTDHLTGLIWLKNANCFGTRTWNNALVDCNGLSSGWCGLTDGSSAGDWRLPSIRELQSHIDYDVYNLAIWVVHPYVNVQSDLYWSSSTFASDIDLAWVIDMNYGGVYFFNKPSTTGVYVWPVRGGR